LNCWIKVFDFKLMCWWIRIFNSNIKLLHTRLVPINISNRYATSDYTTTH